MTAIVLSTINSTHGTTYLPAAPSYILNICQISVLAWTLLQEKNVCHPLSDVQPMEAELHPSA